MTETILDDEEQAVVVDSLEGWELVDFLQVPVEDVLAIALQEEWINEENCEDLLEFVGLRTEGDENDNDL